MVRKYANLPKDIRPKNSPKHKQVKRAGQYMRKDLNVRVSGSTRMRKFVRACLLSLNSGETFYTSNVPEEEQLLLDSNIGVTKLTADANKELCLVADKIVRSYVTRASMIGQANKSSNSVTEKNLEIVSLYFNGI
jgi:hypothetical protein